MNRIRLYLANDTSARAAGIDRLVDAWKSRSDVELVRTSSRGAFFLEPMVERDGPEGRVAWPRVTPDDLPKILAGVGGVPVSSIPFLAKQTRHIFATFGVTEPLSLSLYEGHGGLAGLRAARQLNPAAVIEEIKISRLRGRGGAGFPTIALVSGGSANDAAVAAELRSALGVTVRAEAMESGAFFARLDQDPPAMWALGWIADYPSPNDFLGVLLGSGASTNYGGWSSSEFDAAIERAISARDPAAAAAAYREAESIVRRDAPAIPLGSGDGWSLVRPGLLGAGENGLGILRMAGLAWAR